MTIYTIANGALGTATANNNVNVKTEMPVQKDGSAAPKKPQSMMEGLGGMVPFIVIMGVFIFLMWNGQRKERKKKEEMLSSIKVGEEIVTIGGIMGTVDTVKEDHFVIKISDNARIKVLKNAVSQIVRNEAANAEPEKK